MLRKKETDNVGSSHMRLIVVAITTNILCFHIKAITALTKTRSKLEYGPMANVMAAQPNIGGALCESSVIPFLVPRRIGLQRTTSLQQ